MIGTTLKEAFGKNIFTKIAGLIASPVLKLFKQRIDPRLYNGASFLGLRGLVIKSHGGADELGFYYALLQAYHEVNAGVIVLLEDYLNKHKQLLEQEDARKEFIEFNDLSRL